MRPAARRFVVVGCCSGPEPTMPAPPPPPAPPEPDAPGHAPAGRTAAPALPADVVLDAVDRDQIDDFDTVYAAQKRRLYGIAYSVLRDAGEAEDAVQETMWRAWRSWRTLREPAKREAWLTRICLNQCFRAKRTQGRVTASDPHEDPDTANPWSATPLMRSGPDALEVPADLDLDRAYAALPVKQRAAVLLHYHHGYTVEQCAELMGCRSGTVRTHVQRALARLREELADG